MKRYKVVGCPKCQTIQSIESATTLKCKICGRTTKMKSDKTGEEVVKVFGSYDKPSVAAEVCKKLKLEIEGEGRIKYV